MRKPNNYDSVLKEMSYEPLKLGGHICVITGYEETTTKSTSKPMLKIALDIAPGDEQAGYYKAKYDSDTRENKKWGCVMYVVTEDNEGNASKSLAGFVTSLEESNPPFKFPWDGVTSGMLRGKKIGVVFGQEEYMNQRGEIKKATKPMWFRSTNTVMDAPVPELRKYQERQERPVHVSDLSTIDVSDIPF